MRIDVKNITKGNWLVCSWEKLPDYGQLPFAGRATAYISLAIFSVNPP